ncbi:MAG: GNAT family N-acetyltransferase, partial [Myxococcales bacterium]|nr:GNAT family N-acetyltransferase [Myxococcales bacterium]
EDELHLLDIVVDQNYRRRGLGTGFMRYLEEICDARQLTYLTLEVRETNTPAVSLYKRHGYQVIHRRAKYYADNGEDALVMAKVLGEDED